MANPTVCTVSGTVRNLAGSTLAGVTVTARNLKPFKHSTDSSMIIPYETSTTSASDGTWSLALVETTTDSVPIEIEFKYPTGSTNPSNRRSYTVTIPNSATATFASLIGSQI